jgi:prepilin-type N-terminal cleavage/methylation domain-containing protein
MYQLPRLSPPPTRRPAALGGFSLVEVLVVVTILGIAAAISIPKIARITTQNRVQRAAFALSSDVQQAFAIAGRNRAPVRLAWSSAKMQLQVTNLAGSTVYRRTGLGTGAGYGFTSSEVSMTPTSLVVFPTGLAADTLVIALSKGGFSKTIRVSRAGMVRLQ